MSPVAQRAGSRGDRLRTCLTALLLTTALIATASTRPLAAQSDLAAFSGSWTARWAQGIRTSPDGSIVIERWGDGILEIDVDGDRASATWTTEVRERVQWVLEGTLERGTLVLQSIGHDSGNPELDVVDHLEMRLRIQDAELDGGVWLHFVGRTRPSSERPVRATRTN